MEESFFRQVFGSLLIKKKRDIKLTIKANGRIQHVTLVKKRYILYRLHDFSDNRNLRACMMRSKNRFLKKFLEICFVLYQFHNHFPFIFCMISHDMDPCMVKALNISRSKSQILKQLCIDLNFGLVLSSMYEEIAKFCYVALQGTKSSYGW